MVEPARQTPILAASRVLPRLVLAPWDARVPGQMNWPGTLSEPRAYRRYSFT